MYSYDPEKLNEAGVDLMRFELGDTQVDDEGKTAYLADEEIQAMLDRYPNAWRRAKLELVKSLLHRFSYEVDTKVGPASFSLEQRYKDWKELYEELKKEADAAVTVPSDPAIAARKNKPPYFYKGMHDNPGDISGLTPRGRDKPCI